MGRIVCRCCGKALTEQMGCFICEDAKRAILALGDNLVQKEDETPTLQSLADKNVKLLKLNLDRLEKEMTQPSEKGNVFQDIGFNSGHADETVKLSKAMAQVLKEARALLKETRQRAESATTEEKCRIMVEFFKKLPKEHKIKMHQALAREYNEVEYDGDSEATRRG